MSQQPEEWSWELPPPPEGPTPDAPQRALAPEQDFRRTVGFTIAGTVLPGLGLIAAKRRVVGAVILGLFATVLVVAAVWAAVDLQGLASIAVRPAVLNALSVALVLAAVVWVGVIVASHLSLRGRPSRVQRVGGGILVGVLAFAVAAPMAVAARYSYDQANLVTGVFKSEKDSKSATRPTLGTQPTQPGNPAPAQDPWASKPRLNILLLGGDAGADREGTRTDTMILASIDTKTGDTSLFSLPRNMGRAPFPKDSPLHRYYPNGFTNGNGNDQEFALNAVYRNVPASVPADILGPTDNLGADALKLAVGETLGLSVDYYVLISFQGFEKLVNALGGITVNVNGWIPIGGDTDRHIPPKEYILPGANQKMNGRSALWFARGRYGLDDFDRMDRQRCVINAIIKQANPANMLARYESIAKAGKDIVTTDMPQEVLPLMVDLSLRVKDGNVRSIVFKNGVAGFSSPNPDFALMRQRVKIALGEAAAPKATPAPTKTPTSGTTKSPSASPTTETEDVNNTCAYSPEAVAKANRPPGY